MVQGRLLAQRVGKGGQPESALIQPGSLISCAAHLSNSRSLEGLQAAEDCRLLAFSPAELSQLLVRLICDQSQESESTGSQF